MFNKKIIGEKINYLLGQKDKRQKDLAKILGVTDNTISYYVNGNRLPSLEQIIEIAKYFEVSTDYLLGLNKNPTTDETEAKITQTIGIGKANISCLQKALETGGAAFELFFNYLTSSPELMEALSEYFNSFMYRELEKEKYKYIPRDKILGGCNESSVCKKISFANIIESLPVHQRRYINLISDDEKENIVLEYLFSFLETFDETDYVPTGKEQRELENFGEIMEQLNEKYAAQRKAYADKEKEAFEWLVSEYEKRKKSNAND